MKKHIFAFIIVILAVFYTTQIFCMENSELSFKPVSHASFVITAPQHTIYVDPVGSIKSFEAFPKPDMILITDIHRDHLDAAIIKALSNGKTEIIGPKAVIKSLAYGTALDNGDSIIVDNIQIQAIPMYNTTQDRLKFHPKGRGNGYLLTLDQKRIYISGDTEDIPEMRRL
ncbi:MAG: MBL fold metallo-hydrolase, partial [Proteobacteria bacterium]|nr:MBL fold metallo-hydrolase [Pseudomonadota bacterium]